MAWSWVSLETRRAADDFLDLMNGRVKLLGQKIPNDYGVVYIDDYVRNADGVSDNTAQVQKAYDALDSHGLVVWGPYTYRIDPIVPPNVAFTTMGEGMTRTRIRSLQANGSLFDLTGLNGAAKTFMDIKLEGKDTGIVGGSAIVCNGTNGVLLERVWVAGMGKGIDWRSSSFISTNNCVFESCATAAAFTTAPSESMMRGTSYYSCVTDLSLAGDCSSFIHSDSTHVDTHETGISLVGATQATVTNAGFASAGGGWKPTLCRIASSSTGNRVSLKSHAIGLVGVEFNDSTGNFAEVNFDGVGTGIKYVSGDHNTVGPGEIKNSSTADFAQIGTTWAYFEDNLKANFVGLSGVNVGKRLPNGTREFHAPGAPAYVTGFRNGDKWWNTAAPGGSANGYQLTAGVWRPFSVLT